MIDLKKDVPAFEWLRFFVSPVLNYPTGPTKALASSLQKYILATLLLTISPVFAEDFPRIQIIDSATETEPLLAKPGTYLGEKFIFEQVHSGETLVRVGVWESGAGESRIEDFPFTEYVLMISGKVEVVEQDGTSMLMEAGETFVIPRGWSGTWNVLERMKKQIVRVGSQSLQE